MILPIFRLESMRIIALSIDKIYINVVEFVGKIKVNVLLNLKFCHFTLLRNTNVKLMKQKSWETIKQELKSQQELNMKLSRRHLADYVKKKLH